MGNPSLDAELVAVFRLRNKGEGAAAVTVSQVAGLAGPAAAAAGA